MFAENGGNQEWRGAVCVCGGGGGVYFAMGGGVGGGVGGGGYILQWRGWKIFKVSLAFPS